MQTRMPMQRDLPGGEPIIESTLNNMSRESHRSIGAILGLLIGLGLMVTLNYGGLVPGFLFGAIGAVVGGITGEQIHDRRGSR